MDANFPSDFQSIRDQLERIDPVNYGATRNYVSGAVTYLSPYISRGVISTKQVLESVVKQGADLAHIESFVKELCWRDYFQRVAQEKNIDHDLKQPQFPVTNYEIPVELVRANTGITEIDQAIESLYTTGYMHNHCRMYTAFVACNVAQSHWSVPAKWMYYHLLDGDWASNACSWQWVAGANSAKKYVANQENINKYTHTNQTDTFLDVPYEALSALEIPTHLRATQPLELITKLPESGQPQLDPELPTFVYNYYNLDPNWRADELGNRVLLIEPDFFAAYPISEHCMKFMCDLAKNIPGIQCLVGSFETLHSRYGLTDIYYKEHPLNKGYSGTEDARDWIAEEITGYYPSFFAYWKVVSKQLPLKYASNDSR